MPHIFCRTKLAGSFGGSPLWGSYEAADEQVGPNRLIPFSSLLAVFLAQLSVGQSDACHSGFERCNMARAGVLACVQLDFERSGASQFSNVSVRVCSIADFARAATRLVTCRSSDGRRARRRSSRRS